MKSTNRNIYFIYFYIFLGQLFFDRALWVIYLSEQGLTLGQIGIIEALLHLTIVLFEVPTGMIADLYGRKVSILIGNILSMGYALFMLVSDQFAMFSLAFISLGLLVTFSSGAEEALAYDSLKEKGQEKNYTKVFGSMTALSLLSISLANFVGGWLADINWDLVYTSMLIAHVITIIPILLIKEPKREQPISSATSIKSKWQEQFQNGIQIWKDNPQIRIPIVLFVTLSTTIVVLVFYGQEYFSRLGFTTVQIGMLFTIEGLIGVVLAKTAYRLERKWKFFNILIYGYGCFLVFFVIFIFSGQWAIVISFLLLAQLLTLLEPIFSNYIQTHLSSNVRSTFFSMISLLDSFAIMIAFPAFGFISERVGFRWGFTGIWVILLFILALSLFKEKRRILE